MTVDARGATSTHEIARQAFDLAEDGFVPSVQPDRQVIDPERAKRFRFACRSKHPR